MNLPVAVRKVDMPDATFQRLHLGRSYAHQVEMGDVTIGPDHIRLVDIVEKTPHRINRVDQRQLEGFQFKNNLEIQTLGISSQFGNIGDADRPLVLWGMTSFCQMYSPRTRSRLSAPNSLVRSRKAMVFRWSSPLVCGSLSSSSAHSRSAMGPAQASGNQTSFQRG